jgi:hypothetical protein
VRANIEAIRVLKLIEEEAREATPEEKRALVKYVGWGAFAQAVFDANPHSRNAEAWKAERQGATPRPGRPSARRSAICSRQTSGTRRGPQQPTPITPAKPQSAASGARSTISGLKEAALWSQPPGSAISSA